MPYRQIFTTIWNEPWFAPSSVEAKLLFFYLLTNEATKPTGVLERSARRVSKDLGIPEPALMDAVSTLNSRVRYFPNSECFWVTKFPIWQGKGPKWLKCVLTATDSLPQEVKTAFNTLYSNNTLSDTLCHTLLNGVSDTPPDTHHRNPFPATDNSHQSTDNKQQTTNIPPIVPPKEDSSNFKGIRDILENEDELNKLKTLYSLSNNDLKLEIEHCASWWDGELQKHPRRRHRPLAALHSWLKRKQAQPSQAVSSGRERYVTGKYGHLFQR